MCDGISRGRQWLILSLLLFVFSGVLAGQIVKGSITGVVTDPSGAIVSGATVTALAPATGFHQVAKSNASGVYTFPLLNPGTYDVTATANGFQAKRTTGVVLGVSGAVTVNFGLQLGSQQSETTVSASTLQLLNTEQASVDTTLENVQVQELPVQDRDVMALVRVLPGVVPTSIGTSIGSVGNRNFFDNNFAINGSRTSSNEVLLDGVPDTVGDFNGVALIPPMGSVNEFKLVTGDVSSAYGRTSGGVISMTTKGGTNQYHGEVYEYLQNSALNAQSWTLNRLGVHKEVTNRHHYGFSVGGPVEIPHVYNGHDRTFFFFDYEGRREKNPLSLAPMTVPTLAERQGDFSGIMNAAGQPITIYDPMTTACSSKDANGNCVYTRQPFANNVIPQNRMDPVALAILNYYPKPNLAGAGATNNYAYSGNSRLTKNLYDIRIDENWSTKQSIFGRYTAEKHDSSTPDILGTGASSGRNIFDTFHNFVFGDTYSITPTLISDLRVGYARARANQVPVSYGFDPTKLGFPSYMRDKATVLQFPNIAVGGNQSMVSLGGQGYNNQPRDTESFSESLVKIWGNHTLNFGTEGRLYRFMPFQTISPTGSFSFGDSYTQANPLKGDNVSGLGLASFLLGAVNGYDEFQSPLTLFHHYFADYVQDHWKVTSKLTLDMGLRWELETGTAEAHDRLTYFLPNVPSPLNVQVNGKQVMGALAFTGQGNPRTEWDANKTNFSPRLGFAYAVNDRTTVRGGYGIFFLPTSLEGVGALGVNVSDSVPQPNALIPQTFLSNPFPNGLQGPTGRSAGAATSIGQSLSAILRKNPSPYNQMWDVGVQRVLGQNLMVEADYVGSHGVHLPMNGLTMNQLNSSYLADGSALVKQVDNPFYGMITSGPLAGKTVAQSVLYEPFPQYSSISWFRPDIGASWYQSLQMKVVKRYSGGVSLQATYNWSKTMDLGGVGNGSAFFDATSVQNAYDLAAEKALSDQDVPNALQTSFVYDLPFGHGRHFASSISGLGESLIGGWQMSGLWIWQGGRPLTISARNNNQGIGNRTERANLVSGVNPSVGLGQSQQNARNGGTWFNPAAFAQPGPYSFGDMSRTISQLRGDTYKNVDLGVHKRFHLSERTSAEFRAEAFNLFNQVVFSSPVTSLSSINLGKVYGQANQPRVVQFALRLMF